jgi:hypothetical protein
MIEIRPVASKREMRRFIDLGPELQRGDPHYVAPLRLEREQALSPRHNPFFAHADVRFLLAWADGRPIGRVSAQRDRRLPATGHFGLLAAPDDPAAVAALLAAAEAWLATLGARRVEGPFDLNINEEIGLLVDGFRTPPMLLMPHNQPFLPALVEACGYARLKDVYAYLFDARRDTPRWADRLIGRQARAGVVLRPLDWKRFDADLAAVVDIFNDAWSENWGFMPLDRADLEALAKSMRPLIRRELVQIVEVDGEPAAFGIGLPNLNEAIRDLDGRLLPFGWAKLLWRLKVTGVSTSRVPLMGVRKRFGGTPLGAALTLMVMNQLGRESVKLGMPRIEMSWILEDNTSMRHLCESMTGPPYKTYRIYGKDLAPAAGGT